MGGGGEYYEGINDQFPNDQYPIIIHWSLGFEELVIFYRKILPVRAGSRSAQGGRYRAIANSIDIPDGGNPPSRQICAGYAQVF